MTRNRSLRQSVRCAWRGIRAAAAGQRNFRLQLLVAALVLVLGLLGGLDGVRLALLLLTVLLVLTLELVNTAVEALLDELFPRLHPVAGRVKDLAAGAVWLAALGAVAVGAALFWEVWGAPPWERLAQGTLVALMALFLRLALSRPS